MNKVKNFLSIYQNYNTWSNHRQSINNFFTSVYETEVTHDQLDEIAERYFNEKRDIEKDIEKFLVYIKDFAPLSQRNKISSIRNFLIENDVEIPQKFWRRLVRRIKGSRALTLDKVPSNKQLRKILTHMSVHGKALFLMLSSGGLRIGEALQLMLDDLNLNEEPMRIQIRGEYTKTGNSRYAFASSEAKEAITEWLKVRENYLKAASGKSHKYGKSAEDDRLFPFQKTTSYIMWHGALKKAKLDSRDNSTNVRKLHPHVLRKFFRTRLATVIPVDIVEALMGHEGYLTEVYRRYSLEDLAKFYLKGEPSLLVFTDTQKVVELHKAIEEKNIQLQVLVNSLASENQGMKNEIFEMKDRMKKLEGLLLDMGKAVSEMRKGN
ncbi:site-specific integrase [Candidatus Bathyarchaeota archaeon]|nr:site-specific integrase [Candidatus Bathyarchaeota archaeon]